MRLFDLDNWQEIWNTITRNRIRSVMTAFGVFWGIFMLVVMAGSGTGLQNGIMGSIKGFATNSTFMWSNKTTEAYKGLNKGRSWNIKTADIEIIEKNEPRVAMVTPMLFGGSGNSNNPNVTHKLKSGSFNVKGLNADYMTLDKQEIIAGRFVNPIDISQKRKVCVIGERIVKQLYEGEDPIGSQIKVNGIYYTVVGVIRQVNQIQINGRMDETVILPLSTMQLAYNMPDQIHVLGIISKPGFKVSDLEDNVKNILKKEHSIAPTDADAIGGVNLERQFSMFSNLFLGISILIYIVGLGTLLAGVVGVSNIMMVTIRERTQEIGIRRALGASPMNITSQIMMESLVLTLMAGIGGLGLGVFIMNIVDKITWAQHELNPGNDSPFLHPGVNFGLAVIALFILVLAGLGAGLIPARKALRIKAIDALRDE